MGDKRAVVGPVRYLELVETKMDIRARFMARFDKLFVKPYGRPYSGMSSQLYASSQ